MARMCGPRACSAWRENLFLVIVFLTTEHALGLVFAGFVGYLLWRTVWNWGRNITHYEVIKATREPEPWRIITLARMLDILPSNRDNNPPWAPAADDMCNDVC